MGMLSGIPLLILIAAAIIFIVLMGSKFQVNPFIVLLLAAMLTGVFSGIPLNDIAVAANDGFGNMMKKIGLVVILGTLIGIVLEKSGSILRIAQFILLPGQLLSPLMRVQTIIILECMRQAGRITFAGMEATALII